MIFAAVLLLGVIFWKQIYVLGLQIQLKGEQAELLNGLNPGARFAFAKLITDVKKKTGYTVYLTSAARPYDPNDPSFHHWGLAVDMNLFKGTEHIKKADTPYTWIKTGVPDIALQSGFVWGGNFSDYDPVHFRLNAYTIAQLEAAANTFWGSEWEQRNITKLPLLIPGINVAQA